MGARHACEGPRGGRFGTYCTAQVRRTAAIASAIEAMAALGCPLMQSGTGFGVGGAGDGAFAYIDATAVLGMIVEPIEPPSSLPPPDSIWPQGS
jgi:hypothetical protein